MTKTERTKELRRLEELKCESKSEWERRGYALIEGSLPEGERYGGGMGAGGSWYPVYRPDQVRPKRKVTSKPPIEVPLLAALFTLNRRAKRCRDLASTYYESGAHQFIGKVKKEREHIYYLKGQALGHLVSAGILTPIGYHRFGENWAEVLGGEGYRFHRPCAAPEGIADAPQLEDIEAKPKGSKEPRIKDALFTVEQFLKNKSFVETFEWPERVRLSRKFRKPDLRKLDNDEDSDNYDPSDDIW